MAHEQASTRLANHLEGARERERESRERLSKSAREFAPLNDSTSLELDLEP